MDTQKPIQGQHNEPAVVHEPRYWLITALAVIAAALVVGGGVWWWMNGQFIVERQEMEQQTTMLQGQIDQLNKSLEEVTASNNEEQPVSTADWKTYQNEEVGIVFQYPGNLEPTVSTWDMSDGIITAGRSVEVSFPSENISFTAATSDFNALYRFTYTGEPLPECGGVSNFSSQRMLCKKTTVAGHNAIMKTEFLAPECSPSLPTSVFLPNPNAGSPFAGVEFSVLLEGADDAVSWVFTCVEIPTEAYQVAEVQARAILNNPATLRSSDAARLNLFNEIVDTVRFLE